MSQNNRCVKCKRLQYFGITESASEPCGWCLAAELEAERDEAVKVIGREKIALEEMQICFQTIVDKYTSEGLPEPKPGETLLENICLTLEGWNRADTLQEQVTEIANIICGGAPVMWADAARLEEVSEWEGRLKDWVDKAALTGGDNDGE